MAWTVSQLKRYKNCAAAFKYTKVYAAFVRFHTMTESTGTSRNTGIVLAILMAGALIAGALLYSNGTFKAGPPEDSATIEMKREVAEEFFDPGSAEFRNVREAVIGYCGEVNGKNRFGGYVGFKAFTTFIDSKTGKWETTYDPLLVEINCKQ
jgi:hypothetical protein